MSTIGSKNDQLVRSNYEKISAIAGIWVWSLWNENGNGNGKENKIENENENKHKKRRRNQKKSIYSSDGSRRLQQRAAAVPKIQQKFWNESVLVKWTTYGCCRYRYNGNGNSYRYIYSYSYSYSQQLQLQLQQIQIHLFWITNRIRSFGSQSLSASQSIFMCMRVCFMYYELKIPVGHREYAHTYTYIYVCYIYGRTDIHIDRYFRCDSRNQTR